MKHFLRITHSMRGTNRIVLNGGLDKIIMNGGQMRWIGSPSLSTMSNSSSTPSTSVDLNSSLIITKSCARRIRQLQSTAQNDKLQLRIAVDSGGCSGFQYVFKMEDPSITDDDIVFERDGSKVVVDSGSLEFIKGSTIDFEQELIRSSFAVVNNPQSESACGCGSSFAVKNFDANPAID